MQKYPQCTFKIDVLVSLTLPQITIYHINLKYSRTQKSKYAGSYNRAKQQMILWEPRQTVYVVMATRRHPFFPKKGMEKGISKHGRPTLLSGFIFATNWSTNGCTCTKYKLPFYIPLSLSQCCTLIDARAWRHFGCEMANAKCNQ